MVCCLAAQHCGCFWTLQGLQKRMCSGKPGFISEDRPRHLGNAIEQSTTAVIAAML